MEYFYIAYTKQILDKEYYFIKRYMSFPELKNASNILDGYGMHSDFHKACRIAGITDSTIKEQLWKQVAPEIYEARIVPMIVKTREQSVRRIHWPNFHLRGLTLGKLRLKF